MREFAKVKGALMNGLASLSTQLNQLQQMVWEVLER